MSRSVPLLRFRIMHSVTKWRLRRRCAHSDALARRQRVKYLVTAGRTGQCHLLALQIVPVEQRDRDRRRKFVEAFNGDEFL